jgi:hypothetical protein
MHIHLFWLHKIFPFNPGRSTGALPARTAAGMVGPRQRQRLIGAQEEKSWRIPEALAIPDGRCSKNQCAGSDFCTAVAGEAAG